MGQLSVCLVAVWPIRYGFVSEARRVAAEYSKKQESPNQAPHPLIYLDWQPSQEEQKQLNDYERRIWAPAALNFPAGCLDIPYAMLSSAHEEWRPMGIIDFRYWRDLYWPILGIIFWWSVGKSLEGLLLARKGIAFPLSWRHPVLGLWEVLTGGIAMALGLSFWADRQGVSPEAIYAGGVLWVLLGLMTVTAFWLQRRVSSKSKSI